jgi:ribonuclease HII
VEKRSGIKYLIGIDEAGRGALAGPVSVGLVAWEIKKWPAIKKFLKDYPVGKDSKKLTPKQRDWWFGKIEELAVRGWVSHKVALVSNKVIDKKGINWAIKKGIEKNLCEVASGYARNDFSQGKATEVSPQGARGLSSVSLVLLDGGLKAPSNWPNQKTIIKGDEKELIIGLASIVAKVSRDRAMVKLSKKYPNHHLHQHKGYGTKLHYQKITEFGVLLIHRETYLPN